MIAPSHLVVGQFAFLCTSLAAGHKPALAEVFVAAAAALLPDLDKRDGIVGRLVPWLSSHIEHWFGHRTATHSLLAAILIALAAWPLPSGYWLALIAGYASHPIADMMTPAGVAWFWPSRVRCVMPGNARYRMEAMSLGELWFVISCAVLSVPVLAAAHTGVGPLGVVRDLVGNLADARTHYDAHKSEADWWLDVAGQDNHAFRPVQGKYRVVGPWQSGGLLLETPSGPVTICREGTCDWYAERAVLVRGADEQTTTRHFRSKTTSTGALLDALSMLEPTGQVYLVGRLRAHVPATPTTVTVAGDNLSVVTLTYARPETLRGWPAMAVFDVDLIVQVRHPPGVVVPLVEVREEVSGLSGTLSRHLP